MISIRVTLLVLALSCPGVSVATDYSLHSLAPGESVRFAYDSRGCRHSTNLRFQIHRANGYFAEVTTDDDRDTPRVELSAEEIASLDELIKHYRALSAPGRCTTIDKIILVWLGPRIKGHVEPFEDGSCSAPEEGLAVLRRLRDAANDSN